MLRILRFRFPLGFLHLDCLGCELIDVAFLVSHLPFRLAHYKHLRTKLQHVYHQLHNASPSEYALLGSPSAV